MANKQDTVVGVFLDEGMARQAIQMLQQQSINAHIADQSALRSFASTGLEDDAVRLYESRLNEGNVIVAANAGGKGEQALNTMLDAGAEIMNLHAMGGQAQDQGYDANHYRNLQANQRQYGRADANTGMGRTAEDMRLQLREETLTPVKQAVQAGEVEVHKVVHEREQQVPVTLRHEEVTIERHAVDRPVAAGEITDMQDEVIRVPVYEEQAELQKQARVREEVVIGKQAHEHQETLTGTARHEHVEVKQAGNVVQQGAQDVNVRDQEVTTTRTETSRTDY